MAAPDPVMGPIEELDDPVLLSFSFNQADLLNRNRVMEEVSRKEYQVRGHKTLVKKGIDGTALHFDGYYSGISVPFTFPDDEDGFTIEAWVALGAYPFGPAPVIHQSIWEKKGFYLGINEDGFPAMNIVAGENLVNAASDEKLELFKWYHLVGTVDLNNRTLNLYVNGEKAGTADLGDAELAFSENDLMIGLNSQLLPDIEGRIRRGKWPSMYGIDGLIDEVRIYSHSTEPEDVKGLFSMYAVSEDVMLNPDMQARNMPVNPAGQSGGRFGAKYTTLDYYETWDNLWRLGDHADVVVSFDDMPVNIVSWRGTSYGPYFVTENGKWIGDQSNEDYRLIEHPGEAEGCLEHMSDKQCRHSHIRIIENTDARVVLHWRYGLVDSRYLFAPRNEGWGGWTDEYWTIYPDGVAVRDVRRGIVFGDGWVETMFLSAPGTMPEDNTELDAFTFINEEGEQTLSWADGMPSGSFDDIQLTMVNSKAEYKMFNVYPTGSSIEVFGGRARRSKFHWWNHWPVSQITSDGRGARAADRMAHSSLVWGAPTKHMLMYGITNKPLAEMTVLERSWNSPPAVVDQSDNEVIYDQGQRAYFVNGIGGNLALKIDASEDSPLYNACFIVSDWGDDKKAKVTVNGKELREGSEFRQGTAFGTDGEMKKILWLEILEEKPAEIEILR